VLASLLDSTRRATKGLKLSDSVIVVNGPESRRILRFLRSSRPVNPLIVVKTLGRGAFFSSCFGVGMAFLKGGEADEEVDADRVEVRGLTDRGNTALIRGRWRGGRTGWGPNAS